MQDIDTSADLICPECGCKQKAIMPTEGKQHFFKCCDEKCNADISIKEGECCVFCAHSNKKCPEKQSNPDDDKSSLQSLI